MTKQRLRLTVAYDGTDYCGWAAQTGRRSIQGTLTEAVRRVSGEETEIVGSSRTDSGAHARGQVCHFDTNFPQVQWKRALNRILPEDLRIQKVQRVASDFNSRFWVIDRHYRYCLLEKVDDPFRNRFGYGQHYSMDVERMQAAASVLVGKHDFRAFTEELQPHIENTVRKLFSVRVERIRDEVRIDVAGTAFLRGMMRRISGLLWDIGRHRRPIDHAEILLSDRRNELTWPVVLPARGLTLMKIRYGRHPRDFRDALPQDETLNDCTTEIVETKTGQDNE